MSQYSPMDIDSSQFRRTAQRYQQKMTTLLQDCLYQQMESQSDMCDVTLVIGGVERKAHWCVLAVCPYFGFVYKSNMKEKLSGKIPLVFGDPSAIRAAIRFLYTGTVEITEKNMREIFQVSDFYQIEQLTELCGEFLKCVRITVKNCVTLCILGNLYNLESVYNTALTFMNGHLAEVLEEDEALTLATDSVMEMITNETLSYVSVEQFFGFLVKWVECDLLQRQELFCGLFSHLNLSKVTNTFLSSEIERHSFVKNCVNCQTHLTAHKEKLKTGEISQETDEKEVVLVLGGIKKASEYRHHVVDSVYAYIITENIWVQLPPLPSVIVKPLAASDGKQAVYVMEASLRSVLIYKFVSGSKEWLVMNVKLPTNFTFQNVEEISCVGGKVFAMLRIVESNLNDGNCEENCHIFELNEIDLKLEEKIIVFTQCKNSQFKCCTGMDRYIICVCFPESNTVYSSGDTSAKFVYYDTEGDVLLNSSEVTYFPQDVMYAMKNEIVLTLPGSTDARSFNLDSRKWRNQCIEFALPLPQEKEQKTGYCYCYHEGQLYMFGGLNSTSKHPVNSVIKFNFDTQQCESMENLPEPLMNSACCVMTLPTDLLLCYPDCPHCEMRRQDRQRDSLPINYGDDVYDYDDGDEYDYDCYDDEQDVYGLYGP